MNRHRPARSFAAMHDRSLRAQQLVLIVDRTARFLLSSEWDAAYRAWPAHRTEQKDAALPRGAARPGPEPRP